MKREILVLLVASFAFIGCGGSDVSTQTVDTNSLAVPSDYSYKVINNRGLAAEGILDDYTIKIFSNHEVDADPQSRHYGVVVKIGDKIAEEIPIQSSYINETIVVTVYKDNKLIDSSDVLTIDDSQPLIIVDIDVNN
ncbi:hypothetical protein KKC13_03375 [bacterium]|nr:hypothetical protein [bacterium]MBU1957392.1 hypothetical protein [bacterium]